eukprot:7560038-Pyramimonas_sp.AAC.1
MAPRALCFPIQDARWPRRALRLWRLAHGDFLHTRCAWPAARARGGPQSESRHACLRAQVNLQRLPICVPTYHAVFTSSSIGAAYNAPTRPRARAA